ncbi:hypothetical protein [Psychrobacter pygoscelis]|uniref:hypothetical protein n=1 Tax=Psychrobacter pygoscelis TaxID=2488563 RepID=UPI00103B4F5D|nr:hypothetical protein [Psychrobacter pygoscelis]
MLTVLPFLVLAGGFFYINRHEPTDTHTIAATVFVGVYLLAYIFFIAPESIPSHRYINRALILLPFVSYGAVLFPEVNTSMPVSGTRGFGWLGLVVAAGLLIGLNVFLV